MNNTFPIIPLIYFLLCGISGLILWYRMLSILKSKGRKVNYSLVTLGQLIEFGRVIMEEKDLKLKNKYRVVFWTQIALIPLFFIGMIVLIWLTIIKK